MNKIALQGILYDKKSSYLQGAALAPPLIRKCYMSASTNFYAENGKEIRPDIFDDKGDFEISQYFDIEDITLSNLNKNKNIISLGGDHSITYPIIKAIHRKFGPVHILHIDAHGDLYDEFEGDKFSHACPFARIMEEQLATSLFQVGIRTYTTHQREQVYKYGVRSMEMTDFNLNNLPQFKGPLYVSMDMDALDPAYAPGVSHYEPGGLSTRQVLGIIERIKVPILAADIVEYNPNRDYNSMTGMVCAKLLKELAAKMG